jgi:hypothetical protein
VYKTQPLMYKMWEDKEKAVKMTASNLLSGSSPPQRDGVIYEELYPAGADRMKGIGERNSVYLVFELHS